jgi:hypothetical protein
MNPLDARESLGKCIAGSSLERSGASSLARLGSASDELPKRLLQFCKVRNAYERTTLCGTVISVIRCRFFWYYAL